MPRLLSALALGLLAGRGASNRSGRTGRDQDKHSHGSAPHKGHPSGSGGTLHVVTDPDKPVAGQPATLRLVVHEAGGEMLKDFAIVHDQKVHLAVVREGLDQFAHLHPEIDRAGNVKVVYTLPTGGKCVLVAHYQPSGKGPQVARAEVTVRGDAPGAPALTLDIPGVVTGEGRTADVSVEKGCDAKIQFRLKGQTGKAVTDPEPPAAVDPAVCRDMNYAAPNSITTHRIGYIREFNRVWFPLLTARPTPPEATVRAGGGRCAGRRS